MILAVETAVRLPVVDSKRFFSKGARPSFSSVSRTLVLAAAVLSATSSFAQDKWPGKNPPRGPLSGAYDNEMGSPLLDLVDSATSSIDIEIYQMENAAFLARLRAAMAHGVKIRVVKDPKPLGDACDLFPGAVAAPGTPDGPDSGLATAPLDPACENQRRLKAEIIRAGGAFVAFNKVQLCESQSLSCFQHGKLVIVDGKTAMVSTGNFNDTNLCDLSTAPVRCDRDFSVVTRDAKVVQTLKQVFSLDLNGKRYEVQQILDSNASVSTLLTVSPRSLDPLVAFIESAKKSIDLQNQYLNDPRLNAALLRATARGVAVNVMVSSVCAFGPPTPKKIDQTRVQYGAFETAGMRTHFFTSRIPVGGVAGYLHSKVIIIDGARAWVGSVNGSTGALTNNREFGLFLTDPASVGMLVKRVAGDREDAGSESYDESVRCVKDNPYPGMFSSNAKVAKGS